MSETKPLIYTWPEEHAQEGELLAEAIQASRLRHSEAVAAAQRQFEAESVRNTSRLQGLALRAFGKGVVIPGATATARVSAPGRVGALLVVPPPGHVIANDPASSGEVEDLSTETPPVLGPSKVECKSGTESPND